MKIEISDNAKPRLIDVEIGQCFRLNAIDLKHILYLKVGISKDKYEYVNLTRNLIQDSQFFEFSYGTSEVTIVPCKIVEDK